MGKIVIDESELADQDTMRTMRRLADFFDRFDNPYRMPNAMVEWLRDYNEMQKVDTFYQVPVGYSHNALSLRFMFKRSMIQMEFCLPDGTRLMELRLHE